MVKFIAVLKLSRWPNLLIIASTMLVSFFSLKDFIPYQPFYNLYPVNGIDTGNNLSLLSLLMLIMAVVLIAAAGNIINDIKDVEIDKINKPEKVIIGNQISKYEANVIYIAFNVMALFISAVIGAKLQFEGGFFVLPIMIGLLYIYSVYLKKMPLIGNLVVAILSASAITIPHWFENISFAFEFQIIPYLFFAFAFLISLVREIVKDMEDLDGDSQQKAKTLPIVIGMKASKWLVIFLMTLCLLALGLLKGALTQLYEDLAIFIMAALMGIFGLFFGYVFNAKSKKDFHKLSSILKIEMIIGLLVMLVFLNA